MGCDVGLGFPLGDSGLLLVSESPEGKQIVSIQTQVGPARILSHHIEMLDIAEKCLASILLATLNGHTYVLLACFRDSQPNFHYINANIEAQREASD